LALKHSAAHVYTHFQHNIEKTNPRTQELQKLYKLPECTLIFRADKVQCTPGRRENPKMKKIMSLHNVALDPWCGSETPVDDQLQDVDNKV
jgi:hypothetical protein